MKIKPLCLLLILFGMLLTVSSTAQTMLTPITLENQVENSSLIIEGKVISKKSFWDAGRKYIYTRNTVEVYKVFKGKKFTQVDVITWGGTVGTDALIVSPSLKLQKGDIGVFTLYKSPVEIVEFGKTIENSFKPYSSLQGFYKYNLYNDEAINTFSKRRGIKTSFYDEIMSYTKTKYIKVTDFDSNTHSKFNNSKNSFPPTSITFSPTVASAGTKTVLTINGSGFGATKGAVGFSNADDGGGSFIFALDTQVLTWSDTEITVEIPCLAGTGSILVQDAGGSNGFSTSDLIITYSEINIDIDPDDNEAFGGVGNGSLDFYAYALRHIDTNGTGGLTWELQTDFFNDTEFPGARAAFEVALDQWRCETNINWGISNAPTSTDVMDSDGVNVVRFDNNADPSDNLEPGVLGVCLTRISGCQDTTPPITSESIYVYVAEMDLVFDDQTNWYFGNGTPTGGQIDFQSVALHELGHGHQLGHVIDNVFDGNNQDDVMHYAIGGNEQQRVLTLDNITAANNVHTRSTTLFACTRPLMTNSTVCEGLSNYEKELKNSISLFPNPAKHQFSIKNSSTIKLQKIVVYDLSGRRITEQTISNSSKIETVNLAAVSKGLYLVNIHSENAVISEKLVIN